MDAQARILLSGLLLLSRASPVRPTRPFLSPRSYSSYSSSFDGGGGSAGRWKKEVDDLIRRHKPFKPFPTVRLDGIQSTNSCSFIGSVAFPPKRYRSRSWIGGVAAYTVLVVNTASSGANSVSQSFRILLSLRDDLAEIALKHLKGDDFIYASGRLGSYEKIGESGKRNVFQKVYVKEMNFVTRNLRSRTSKPENLQEDRETGCCDGEIDHDKAHGGRLRLWQIFFSNPYEWWDNRHQNSRQADFRHRDTHECLTLRPDDPMWVRRQLELYDSETTRRREKYVGSSSRVSEWKFSE